MNVEIDDDLEMRFREAVFLRKIRKEGTLKSSTEEAIRLWLDHVGADIQPVRELDTLANLRPVDPRSGHPIQRLAEDPATQEKIKELWRAGERNRPAIAQAVGYKVRTVQQFVKNCLDSGELVR